MVHTTVRYSIRRLDDPDPGILADIYRAAIRFAGGEHYSEQQVLAWSGFADDRETFANWIAGADNYGAVDGNGRLLGFAAIKGSGHVESLFVRPDVMRKGVGSGLLARIIADVRGSHSASLTVDASACSRPVFTRSGFTLNRIERVRFRGVAFERYAMELRIL